MGYYNTGYYNMYVAWNFVRQDLQDHAWTVTVTTKLLYNSDQNLYYLK